MKRVIILKGDDWQACYVDGKCIDQYHSLGEGYGMIHFIKEASKKHNFTLDDVEEFYCDDIDGDILYKSGRFPDNFSELKGKYVEEKNVGDLVWVDGHTSFAQQNAQEYVKIDKKEYRYDEITGEKFPIYLVGGEWYDGRDGGVYDNEYSMYYIDL